MLTILVLFLSYFFIGAFISFCQASFLTYFIIGFGAVLFYFEDFEEWSYLTTGIYLIFSFLNIIKSQLVSSVGLFIAGVIVFIFSYTKKKRFDYSEPISIISCTASGTSVALGLSLALFQLDFWNTIEKSFEKYNSSLENILKFCTLVLSIGFILCLAISSSISIYKSSKFFNSSSHENNNSVLSKSFITSILVVILSWVGLIWGNIIQAKFSIFN